MATVTVLALDTTRRGAASLALTGRDAVVVESVTLAGPLDVSLPPVLAGLARDDLEAVVVITGPGSYTGVRAGMALGLGLATARALPLHGVDILTAIAAAGPVAPAVTAAVDAGRGGAYARGFDHSVDPPRPLGEPRRVAWQALHGAPGVLVSPAPAEGVAAVTVATDAVLAAAVRLALAAPPLAAAGLAAVPAPPPG